MHNFTQIVTEQKEELDQILTRGWVPREIEKDLNIESRLAQIIAGVRRSGKSTLAHRSLRKYLYAYANFDDERLFGLKTDQLDQLLEALYSVYGEFSYLLLDEIQNVDQWPLFVNRMLRNNIHVILTGSNSKLLSGEPATHLTGRHMKTELLPFSFREYLHSQGALFTKAVTAKERGLLSGHLSTYMQKGGFPDVHAGEHGQDYISTLFDSIVTKDIIYRYNLRYARTFREIALYLTSCYSTEISYNRIKRIFGLGSENTAKNYVQYLEEGYLIICLPKFSFKKQESVRYRKLYLIDTGFASLTGESPTKNSGRFLENVVFLELYRRAARMNFEVFYYKKNVEVDFIVYKNRKIKEMIQVAHSIADQRTVNREVRALVSAGKELNPGKLILLTLNEKKEIISDGLTIQVIPVTDWLLSDG
jgi:hypothetical protein